MLFDVELHQDIEDIVHVLLKRKAVLPPLLQHGAYRGHLMMVCAELSSHQRPSSVTVHPGTLIKNLFQALIKGVKERYRFPYGPIALTLIWFAHCPIWAGHLWHIGLHLLLLLFLLALALRSYRHRTTRDSDLWRLLACLSQPRLLHHGGHLLYLTPLNRGINYQLRYLRRLL